jgi:hypothetical protein
VVLHLYGIVAPGIRVPDDTAGRDGASLHVVADDELAVVVSDVELDRPAGPKDLLAHARVLERLTEQATVVPMQFGIVLPDEVAVHEQVLQGDREELLYLLGAFEGRVQLTVQAFHHEEPALREVLRRDPALVAERDRLRSMGGPMAQQREVQLGQAVAQLVEYLQEEDRQVLLDRLAPRAEAVSENEPNALHQLLNAAFLVPRAEQHLFDEEVAALAEELQERVRIRYVGPQPPYAFLEPVRSGELTWA